MGVVTVSSSASRTPFGLNTKFLKHQIPLRRCLVLAFKAEKAKNTALATTHEPIPLPIETSKDQKKRLGRAAKPSKRVKPVSTDEVSPCSVELDFNEAAAKLENIYKLSLATDVSEAEDLEHTGRRRRQRRNRVTLDDDKAEKETGDNVVKNHDDKAEKETGDNVVKNHNKKPKRLRLEERIALSKMKEENVVVSTKKKRDNKNEGEKIDQFVREYSASTDLVSLDWKKMKIPPVLPSSEHAWLFKLMQPMKGLLEVKENLQKDLGSEPTDGELAKATSMSVVQVRRHMEVGQAARNKLIKHNLRLVLFVINKYFQEFSNGPKFQDLCQAGVKGLITAIDRFEPLRSFRLSTYGLFWIRHAIMRSMTLSSFTRVSFGLDSVRIEIQRAKLELLFKLHRLPTEEEIIQKVGISPERYHEVMRASRSVLSLHAKHATTRRIHKWNYRC